ncbi:MAG: hypothetical protein E7289_06835 [Lachnospiraceae bacterium]|nr:hypothetical protein [Lachnospiraceae bacterium]
MRKKLTQLSDVLPELWVGILLYGVLCEIVGLIFVEDWLFYSIGLIAGIVCALFMATHMAWSLNQAMELAEGDAVKKMQVHNIVRYLIVVVVFFLLLFTKLGNPLIAFLGVMGLKVAAYLQPVTHKFFRR